MITAIASTLSLPGYSSLKSFAVTGLFIWVVLLAVSRLLGHVRTKSVIRNLPKLDRGSWFSGNLLDVFDIHNMSWHYGAIKKYGGAVQIHGILGDEQIYIADPRAMHQILIKEMHNFPKPSSQNSFNEVALGQGLLTVKNMQHRKQRKILNPVFHIRHMRALIPTFCKTTRTVAAVLEGKLKNGPVRQEINMFDWLSRLALELVGQGGLGYSFDTLAEGEKSEYTAVVKDLMPTQAILQIHMIVLPTIVKRLPAWLQRWLANHLPTKPMRRMKRIIEVIESTSKDALRQKLIEIAQEPHGLQEEKGLDVLTVLLRANARASEKDRLTDEEVIGQMSTIIFAAQDTTSSALSRAIHTLASHRDAQERLREEIRMARNTKVDEEDWTYDDLNELPYLDAVCRETLRVFAPVSRMKRTALAATSLPLLRPVMGTDGQLITSIPIARNQGVVIGIAAANRDEAVWGSDAHLWRPDRWLDHAKFGDWRDIFEAKEDWDNDGRDLRFPGVYSGMMTFSGGGRACIGFKFSLLEMKVVLAMLIEKFKFELPDKEIVWNLTNIQTPSLKGQETDTPRMPTLVSLA